MYVTVVHIQVRPDHVTDFLGAIRRNREKSVLEPGNLRFDILRSADDAARFVTYMAYEDEATAKAHTTTAHLLAFREEVADWMVVPRENVRYDGLFPADVEDVGVDEVAPARGGPMFVTIVHIHVKPEHVSDLIESIRPNHEGSILEPGNLRFDILQSVDDPTRFIAYEAYVDEYSAWAHKETPHYLRWRDQVAGWMAEPRQGARYEGLFPALGSAAAPPAAE
jgi:autoinducer 2-degrading protein